MHLQQERFRAAMVIVSRTPHLLELDLGCCEGQPLTCLPMFAGSAEIEEHKTMIEQQQEELEQLLRCVAAHCPEVSSSQHTALRPPPPPNPLP